MIEGDEFSSFVAVATQRSFSKAANTLGVAQSVVSKRLRRLEDQVAMQLVDRSNRTNIRLTRFGSIFLPEATHALECLRRTELIASNLARGSTGPVRIGFIFSAAMNGALATILTGLRARFPELHFEPRLMETPEQLAGLAAAQLDMGLLRPRLSYPASCQAAIVHTERLMVCLRPDHPLMELSSISPTDLRRERFIMPQFHEEVGLIDDIRALAKAGKFAMPEIIRTGDFVTAVCLAATGDGIVIAPASIAKLTLQGVCFREINDFDRKLETILVHRTDAPEAAAALALSLFRD